MTTKRIAEVLVVSRHEHIDETRREQPDAHIVKGFIILWIWPMTSIALPGEAWFLKSATMTEMFLETLPRSRSWTLA